MNNYQHTRLWKVHKTVYEMLDDRGYTVSKDLLDIDLLSWREEYQSNNQITYEDLTLNFSKNGNSIYVFFSNDVIGVQYIERIIKKLTDNDSNKAILVVNQPVNDISKNIINLINNSKFNIEIFQEKQLLFNITKHVFVPKHSVITESQKRDILKTYRIKETQLPRILANDPIVRYYGLKKGQVVKITRPSETAGEYILYRLIV